MKKEEILQVFKDLAKSQGMYGRLLENITDEALEHLEEQNFGDVIDLIMFIEG